VGGSKPTAVETATYRARGLGGFLVSHTPMILFTFIYVFTCLIGAVLLMIDYRPYASLFEYFSGLQAPSRPDLVTVQLILLLAAPIAMWIGFVLAMKAPLPPLSESIRNRAARLDAPPWLPHVVFYALAGIALITLTQFAPIADLRAWLDPQTWIDARYRAFREVSFVGFVNLYTLVPLAAAWIVVTSRGQGVSSYIVRWLPVAVALFVSLLLFQKRPALIMIVIVVSTLVLVMQRTNPSKARRTIATGALALICTYMALVMIPAYFQTQVELSRVRPVAPTVVPATTDKLAQPSVAAPVAASPGSDLAPTPAVGATPRSAAAPTVNPEYPVTPEIGAQPPATSAPAVITEGGKTPSVLLYALLGPLNRTSVSALYYPVVFPDVHGFYGLDVGQDMLGKLPGFTVNRMPDDNIVVWDYMAPAMPGGRVAAPFQFVLYSQVGLLGALAGSLIAGVLLALAWRGVQDRRVPTVWASLAGALVLLLSVFLAMDSARNSLLVSYGVFWGFLFIGAAMTIAAALKRLSLAGAPVKVGLPGLRTKPTEPR
jgi:hypothetical protein